MADRRAPVSRRRFVASTVGAAVGAGRAVGVRASQPAAAARTGVDQNPIRRRGVGLRALDPDRACPGLTLFAPAGGTDVYLIDLKGSVVHQWKMPYRPGL